jgi:four helix bundle protein
MAFDALEVALQINRLVAPLTREIGQHDPDMARQIRKAAQSIPANLAEGRKRVGRDRLHHFRVAAGSAAEVKLHLESAEAWSFIGVAALEQPLELLDRELAMTWRLTHPR